MFNTAVSNLSAPPVSTVLNWKLSYDGANGPLIDMSQAVPGYPAHEEVLQSLSIAAADPALARYGPVEGDLEFRTAYANHTTDFYGSNIETNEVQITSGCNQAFCSIIATIAGPGDNVIVPSPWYFNHKMWLDMSGINTRILPLDEKMFPVVDVLEEVVDKKTKAIVLVTPNNPTGVEYPNELLSEFYEIAKRKSLLLIIDETYRDFHSRNNPIHDLFREDKWEETLVSLYSFSKAYRLTGHRVGAVITSERRLCEIEKFLDSVTICPNQLGQVAALHGLKNSASWLVDERIEILSRQKEIKKGFKTLENWQLKGCGAYFAYVENSSEISSEVLCQELLANQAILTLPEAMFTPQNQTQNKKHLRIAFANINSKQINDLFERLKNFRMS